MRTSLIETAQIEAHLFGLSDQGDALVFEARLLLDDELTEKLYWQQQTYVMIKAYGRKQLKKEIAAVHQKLFSEAEHLHFSQKIKRLFSKR